MKLVLILLTLVASSIAVEIDENSQKSELAKDIQEFVNLIPNNEIIEISIDYLLKDEQFEDVVLYLQSEGFKKLIIDIESLPQVHVLLDYLEKNGVHIYELVNKLNDLLDINQIKPSQYRAQITGGGIKGYLKDIQEIIPLSEIKNLFLKKLISSNAFIDFIAQLKSDNFQEIVNYVYKHPEFQKILMKLKQADADISIIRKFLLTVLGIKLPEKPFFLR